MTFVVLRLRSPVNIDKKREDTLKALRLTRVNHCTIVRPTPEIKGMLKKVKDIVTWGDIEPEVLTTLLRYRSNIDGGLTDKIVSEFTDHETVEEFSEAVISGEEELESITILKNLFRMHPPKGGHRGIKKPYKNGGSLGYCGKDINALLDRMVGPEYRTNETQGDE